MLAVAGRDRDVALVDQRQVPLGGAEHVEVVAEPGPGVELPQDRGDPRAACPSARRLSFDIVRASSHSRTKTSHSGTVWMTRGATPASAAATVLWSSLPRSTARRSVPAPGIRTKQGVPSTSTR